MKYLLLTVAYVTAIVYTVAAVVVSGGEPGVSYTTGDGLRAAVAFAAAWFQAGGNLIPNFGWQQAIEAWAGSKV